MNSRMGISRAILQGLAVVIVPALLLTGCPRSREDVSNNGPAKTSTTVENQQVHPENSTAMNPVVPSDTALPSSRVPGAASKSLDVQLTEYEIRFPDTLPPGPQSLHIANGGKERHGFVIEGPNGQQRLPADLSRGDVADLTVNLVSGTYTVYCPVDGHRGKGMSRTLTVK